MAIYTEFENENRLRNFPFSEDSSLLDTDGVKLDPSFFVDASIYPLNPVGDVRLSSIDYD